MIVRQIRFGEKRTRTDGRMVFGFENGSAFVQLIKHGDIEHLGASLFRGNRL